MSAHRLSPREAYAKLCDGYLHIDVRTQEEFAAGHASGAFNVPVSVSSDGRRQDNPRFVELVLACFGRDAKLVLSCRSGQRSQLACKLLREAGVRDVLEQRAGFSGARDAFGSLLEPGWQAEGLPCASEPEPGKSYAELLALCC